MIFVILTILSILLIAMLMSMMDIPARAWVRVAAVVKRKR